MALSDFLLELLVDPTDHGPLLYLEDEALLYNPRLRRAYEVRGSIPVLLAVEARTVGDAEHEGIVNRPGLKSTGRA